MTPLDILLTPLLNNITVEDAHIKVVDNQIEIVVESDKNLEHLRWVNIVEVEPSVFHNCYGEVQQAPYFDPPMGCGDDTIYYWDDLLLNFDKFVKDNWIETNKITFVDVPYTSGLKPTEYVKFTTCLYNTKYNLCEFRLEWWKSHTNKIKLGKPPKIEVDTK